MVNKKLRSLDELAELANQCRKEGGRVIHCHGTFDLLHTGHIRHLQQARQLGDLLFVSLTSDEFVRKGPGRPVFNGHLRAENLAALECVDYVAINCAETSIGVIELIKPHFYVKGNDYADTESDVTGNIEKEIGAVRKHGGDIHFTNEIIFSSTKLLNNHFNVFPEETQRFLADFKTKYSIEQVLSYIKKLANLKVLVIGDAIIDEYHYVNTLGQTGKGNTLAVRYQSEERFAGGAVAVANHVAGFCKEVTLFTGIGKSDDGHEFITSKLLSNVSLQSVAFPTATTLIKRRFVDQDLQRLFEVYFGGEEKENNLLDQYSCDWILNNSPDYDVVLVADFGNGFISQKMAESIAKSAPFLAVNTQINSGNRGYHVITRYPNADFLCLNEPEARLAAHDRYKPLEQIATDLVDLLKAKAMVVTRGGIGALMLSPEAVINVPALSSKVVDRIGAGDAFLALAGICMGAGFPDDIVALAGSIAAALDVQIVCNRESVDPILFAKYATTLLK